MPFVTTSPVVDVIHFTDPSCPWAYSAEPLMRTLQWRFGDGLRWRTVMIGLSEDTSRSERSGYTPERRVQNWLDFQRRFGMPVLAEPRTRLVSSGRACRAVVAARAQSRELSDALLRRIRLAWFTSTLLLDEDEGLATVAALVPGLDVQQVISLIDDPATEAAYQADRAETRSAAAQGQPAIAQGRTASSDGPERFTAPSIVFRSGERVARGGRLAAARRLRRLHREPRALARAPWRGHRRRGARRLPGGPHDGELTRVCTEHDDDPDTHAVTREVVALCASGQSAREPLGFGELWRPV